VAAAAALHASATPQRPTALRASSALETGHHAVQVPLIERELGKLPDLAPIGGLSDAINNIPGSTAFFRGHQAAAAGTATAATAVWQRVPEAPAGAAAGPNLNLAGAPAGAQMVAPDPATFFDRVSDLLTCQELEQKVQTTCGSTPIFQAIRQFEKDAAICNAAMTKIVELPALLAEYFGPGADCNTLMDGWKFNGFANLGDCEHDVRKTEFKNLCRLV